MMETPTHRHLAAMTTPQIITDAEGRSLSVRRLTALDKLRLFKAAGPILSQNQLWLGMAILAYSVSAIDDIPIPAPTSEALIEGLISRLGDHGIAAIAQALTSETPVDLVTHAGN